MIIKYIIINLEVLYPNRKEGRNYTKMGKLKCTASAKSLIRFQFASSSKKLPVTIILAPFSTNSFAVTDFLIPPPTTTGIEHKEETALTISTGMELSAPDPASRYINFMPRYSAASAVAAAIPDLFLGIGRLPLIYWAVVVLPDSIRRYPVEIGSMPHFLIMGAARTCFPIKCSGFLPLTTDKYKIASAFAEIWLISPGKMMVGRVVTAFSFIMKLSRLSLIIKLPPIRKPSTPDFSQCLANRETFSSCRLSGSISTKKAAPLICMASNNWL